MDLIVIWRENQESQSSMPVTQLAHTSLDLIHVDGVINSLSLARKLHLLPTTENYLWENALGILMTIHSPIVILKKLSILTTLKIFTFGLKAQKLDKNY